MSFRPDDSPYYYAEYVDAGGKRRRVSTKQTTKREGDRIEAELRARVQRQRHGLEAIERNPNKWTVADAARWWMAEIASKQAQGKHRGFDKTIERHVIKGPLGDKLLEHVTPANVTAWFEGLVTEDEE